MKQTRRFLIALLIVVLVVAAISLRSGERREYLDFAESLDETVATVDDEDITLADMAFYIAYEESVIEEEAYIYNSEDTGEYWNLYSNHTYLRKEAKNTTMDMAIHDAIFYKLALEEGVTLDEEEKTRLANSQYDFWSDLEDEQRVALGVSEDVIKESMRRLAIAEKYQYILAGLENTSFDSLSVGGSAYEELKSEHEYVIDESVWNRVHFGGITVNH